MNYCNKTLKFCVLISEMDLNFEHTGFMKRTIPVIFFLVYNFSLEATSQNNTAFAGSKLSIDSLTHRIEILKNKLNRLKESRDPSLYYVKMDYDQTVFSKMYEELYIAEELEKAKNVIESRLEKATLRKDKKSIQFYSHYKDRVNKDIKMQKMHYQSLFKKEKNFKKKFHKLVKQESLEAYKKAKRMTELAIKYASENNLKTTIAYLKEYQSYIDAVIFDYNSEYDLHQLTRKENDFEDKFLPLLASDSLKHLKEAQSLVNKCYDYAANTKSIIDTNYYAKQRKAVKTAISDYFDKKENNFDLAQITDQAIKGRNDSLNPAGVYKWHDKILVVGYFVPTSSYGNVRKGEAIIKADRLLAKYVDENDIGRIKSGEKFGYTFLLPYVNGENSTNFYYNPEKEMWQYMVCYTKVVNTHFTNEIRKYMPPIRFAEVNEEDDNSNINEKQLSDAN